MAKQTPLEKLNKRYNVSNKNKTSLSNTDKMQKQVDNYKTRLEAAGSDYDASDNRNALEKKLNLEKDQNVLFDILELINRPQNALLTGINNALSGDNFFEGLKEGITGETKTTGKNILVDQLGMEDEEGKLDWSDVLGFGVDLVTDPMDWALIPLTGGASKVAEVGADAAQAATKGAKALKAAGNVADAAKVASKVDDVADAAKGLKFVSGYDLLGKGVGKAFKGTGKLADKVIEGSLGAIDAKNAKKIQTLIDKGMDATEAARALNVNPNKLGLYQDLKKGAKNILDSSSNLGGLVGKSREVEGTSELVKKTGQFAVKELDDEARNIAEQIAKRTGTTVDDAYNKIAKTINTAVESNYDWAIRGDEILNEFSKKKTLDLFTNEQAEKLVKELGDYGIKADIKNGRYVNLLDDKKKLKPLIDEFSLKTFGDRLSAEDLADITEATDFIKNNPELNEFYKKVNNSVSDLAKTSDMITGLNTQEIAKQGYVPHVLTDDAKEQLRVAGRSNNQFNTRKYKMTANETNRQMAALEAAKKDKLAKSIAKKNEIVGYSTDDAGRLILDENNVPTVNKQYVNDIKIRKEEAIKGLNKDLESAKEAQKLNIKNAETFNPNDVDITKLNKKDMKAYNLYKASEKYDETINTLRNVKFDNIPAEHSQVVKDVRNSLNDYKKANTKLMNAIKNGADSDTLKTLGSEVNGLKKQLTVQVKRADIYASKKSINAMQKAFKEGKEIGKDIQSAVTLKKNNTKLLDEIFSANADNIEKLQSTIKYKEAALKNFLKVDDEKIWKKQVDSLLKVDEAYRDILSKEGQEFFKTNYFDNITEFVNRNAEFTKGAKIYNDALATSILDNTDYVKFASDLKDGKIPYGFEKVNGTYIKNKLSKYEGILPDNAKKSMDILKSFEGKDVYMDKQLVNMLNIGSKTSSSELGPLMKLWDGMNNVFKKYTTITPGFHMRNIVGNSTDMVLSGVNATQLPSYYKKAINIWNNADDLVAKAAKGTLNEVEKKQFDILQQFYKGGFADALTKGYGLEDVTKAVSKQTKNPINKISKWSIETNNKVDAYNRLTLLLYANENPKYLEKLGKKTPIDAVRFVLFDPNNLSDVEKSFKKVVPFYTFTKQNLLFQSNNLLKNTGRYSKLYKAIRNGYNDLDEDSYYKYQRDSMQIPLPFTGSDGNQLFLKANLPVSDLGEFLSSPVQRTVASLSPVIKTPIEMTTGKNLFTGNESNYTTLSSSRASKKLNDTLTNMGISTTGITKVEDAADLILNNFGLQNVSTNLVKKIEAILNNADGNTSGQQLWAEIFRSVLQNTKEESVKNSGLYDELEKYQAEIKRLKNQGIDVPTIKEITAGNNIKLNKMKRKRANSR